MKFSYSSISTFVECPEKFNRMYLQGLRGERDSTMESARGDIVHKLMETLVQEKLDTGHYPDIADSIEISRDLWAHGFVDERHGDNPLYQVVWDEEFYYKSRDDTELLIPKVYDDVFSLFEPATAEQYVSIPILGGEHELHGLMDMVSFSPNAIIDWKTRKSPANEAWLATDLQATVYNALAGFERSTVNFVEFIYPKTQKPRLHIATTKRDVRHTKWLLDEVIPGMLRAIEYDAMPPTPGWWCFSCPVKCGAFPDVDQTLFAMP